MTIKNTDIVLFQSQDNTDNENGGGSRTGVPVADGAVNNLFPDISRVDTVSGDVALRKVFPVVNTDDRDIYYGAHAMIRKVPDDERVSALLFYTDDATDVRSSAQSDIEAYLIPSYQASFYLFGSNIEGAKAVTFLQRLEEPVPDVGDVYVLQEGSNSQYIRFADIDSTEIIQFFNGSDYRRRRLIVTIDQALTQTFTGSGFNPAGQEDNTCDTFATQIADAAKFYGNKGLSEDVLEGETVLQLDSIFEQLVPAATQQTPLINQQALQNGLIVLTDDDVENVTEVMTLSSFNTTFQFKSPIQPGSLTLNGFTDDKFGNFTEDGDDFVAKIDYASGVITYVAGSNINNTSVKYKPGVTVETYISFSSGILITNENQGSVYIQNVAPVPTPASCYVDYRSNGKWYRIQGNNDNSLGNNPDLGAGLISDNGDGTATISVTLGANPDIDSTVIFSWGSSDMVNSVRQEALDDAEIYFEWKLPHENIDPDNCEILYQGQGIGGGTAFVTLTFSASGLTQSGQGFDFTLDPEKGIVIAKENGGSMYRPNTGSETTNADNYLQLDYNYALDPGIGDDGERLFVSNPEFVEDSPGVFIHDLETSINVSGLVVSLNGRIGVPSVFGSVKSFSWNLTSDENGILREEAGGAPRGSVTSGGVITVNVPNGSRAAHNISVINGQEFVKYTNQLISLYTITGSQFIEYSTTAITVFGESYTGKLYHNEHCYFNLKLVPHITGGFFWCTYGDVIDSGFDNTRKFYVSGEDVYQNVNSPNHVGIINRELGLLTMQYWEMEFSGNSSDFLPELKLSNLYVLQDEDSSGIRREVFKAGATDLVTSSFILRYSTTNGTFVATTNSSGEFTGTDIDAAESYVDTINGAVYVVFTDDVNPESIKFDCVAQTTLPLDAELLGLNPVRLPPNGKVPVFYAGAYVIVFNEEITAIVGTPVADDVETLSRSGQAYIEVVDVNGQRLAYDQYVADRDAGTVTFANPLSLIDRNGDDLTAPYSIIDRVEDMSLCTDAAVTGRISISTPLSRDYMAGQTRIASALVWGDIGARIFNMFSQSSFDIWDDDPTQSSIPAQFDNINYPVQINNKDSFTGRWAMVFTSSTTVDVRSEKLGVLIEDASIESDIEPVNPATGLPYFTIPTDGWGGGWVTSNVLRFNTESGSENMWIIRTVQSGALTEQTDSIDIEIRGDVN